MNEEQDVQDVLDVMAVLEPTAADAPTPVETAWKRTQQQLDRRQTRRRWWLLPVWQPAPHRYATAVALAGLLLLVSFTFPGVRAVASDFLGLFRVQKITAVAISAEQVAILQEVLADGGLPGEVMVHEPPGEAVAAASVAEAAVLAALPHAQTIPQLGQPAQIWVAPGSRASLVIDLVRARAIVAAVGGDPARLPDVLDGAVVDVVTTASIEQSWANGVTLMQLDSPQVTYPEALDTAVWGEVMLQLFGLNPAEAQRLAATIDWTTTLVLPIPQNAATFQEVNVNGQTGLALLSLDGSYQGVLWQDDGRLYLLAGSQPAPELLALAAGME